MRLCALSKKKEFTYSTAEIPNSFFATEQKSRWSMSLLCKERCKDHSASDILNVLVVLEPKTMELPNPVSVIPPVIARDCLMKSRRFKL